MNLLALPIVVPFSTAILALLLWRRLPVQRVVAVVSVIVQLGVAVALLVTVERDGILVMQVGGWPAPFGISLVADLLSAVMAVMVAIVTVAVVPYAVVALDARREGNGFHVLVQVLLMGVYGALLTGDVFNLYVWFEVMLMSSFILLALGGEQRQMAGAVKYVTLNLISSAVFLTAVGVTYGLAGTLNMAHLAQRLAQSDSPGMVTTVAMLYLTAFGVKAAMFPVYFWLPAAYPMPPPAIGALFSALLTKVGVYALIRVFTLLFVRDVEFTHALLLVLAGFTMVVGVLGAVSGHGMRRILSFHIISQIGYMVMGLGLFSVLGIAGAIYFIGHNMLAKTNLFLISGVVQRLQGSDDLSDVGGLYKRHPLLGLTFLISALGLAGLPPLSGFVGKLVLARAGVEADQFAIAAVSLVVGLLTLISMMKIWKEAFWKPQVRPWPQGGQVLWPARLMMVPICMLALLTISMGVGAEAVLDLTIRTAEQLLEPSHYVAAVIR